ncbi:hypothetical protein [Gimibacter soli]|uniref:Uncharacterized protein n=1 Tax=Gimibacter soli TaxID=3024400 RepID=A0AAE9XNQ9_9PROT|nr:hypothetical protein [Gimibacter soli]WCL54413.1 hypothetical protein PH603_01400 [Gimibacter soli]
MKITNLVKPDLGADKVGRIALRSRNNLRALKDRLVRPAMPFSTFREMMQMRNMSSADLSSTVEHLRTVGLILGAMSISSLGLGIYNFCQTEWNRGLYPMAVSILFFVLSLEKFWRVRQAEERTFLEFCDWLKQLPLPKSVISCLNLLKRKGEK